MLIKTKQRKTRVGGRRCDPPPAYGTVSDNFSPFIYSDVDGISEAIKSNTVCCMHHCYQGDRFLSLAPFFFAVMISRVTRDSWGKTISFYTFIGILVNRWLPFCKPPLTVYWRKKRLHEYRMWILHQKSDNQLRHRPTLSGKQLHIRKGLTTIYLTDLDNNKYGTILIALQVGYIYLYIEI